jgi:cyclase
MLQKTVLTLVLALMVPIGTGAVSAEARQAEPNYNSATVGEIIQIKPDLYFVPGGGANAVIRVTPEGLILVDTKNPDPEIAAALIEQIRTVSTAPVRYVLNTHHHPDHVGNNQTFVDQGATVVGLEKMKELWSTDRRTGEIPGQPTETFETDYTLTFGGIEVEAHFYGGSHTDGDTVVYFPADGLVMVSDTTPYARPTPGINGTNAVLVPGLLDSVLALDFDSAIGGRGPLMTRAEIEAYAEKWDTLLGRARAAISGGATGETLMANVNQEDLGWTFNENFFGQLFAALQSE